MSVRTSKNTGPGNPDGLLTQLAFFRIWEQVMAKNQVITLGEGLVRLNHARLTCSPLAMPYTEANAATTPPEVVSGQGKCLCGQDRENVRTFIYYLTYTAPLGITVGLGSLQLDWGV